MSKTIQANNIEALGNAMDLALERDPNVVLYGQDAGFEGGVFRATKGLQKKYGEERVWDCPIAEAAMAGIGVGAAIGGLKPIVEIQFSGFSFPAMFQIFTHAARIRNRSRGVYTCPIIVRMPMGGGIKALEHHSETLEAIYGQIAGLKTVMPSNPYDTKGLFLAAVESPDPVVFFEPKKLYRAFRQEIPADYYTVPIGQANLISQGNNLTIVSYGPTMFDLINMVYGGELKDKGIELIDLRTISPWDKETVFNSVKKTGRLLVVTEAAKTFTTSGEIIASVTEELFSYLKAAPQRVTGWDIVVPLARGEHYQFNLNARILEAVNQLLK
ncbi:pyruvate dehydrogenase complex E1 component subunit beta [Mycoplasmoides pneumoniae]|uniref:Pyruvate dehydrogenase E1 component subunit beta n=4 Tax=Mycoplasmoides pneumoniae TaxID=2104 RepID=ODPB_MYCPN|nr:pyruvate dehydrogenase complex E1 component subunit beta [Mycoplasmoides pneumoniae]P75391.1 RecName: Full=Pyruvate dehydrogenase E1 component subunit beta [Mycoplasmoides pneumoniae M129]AAB96094.1 pyruvate dehydrogenase E1-beta subunit [Mycoplasmoides pneumoniae M129]ADK87043.1 Pyruvate dehydrogenase E1 component subunit beta [Mycoplasmoides pneumoniae FH]AGC04300.1 2-oxoisovalerate dehydrogenase [Mycoplasmoides pneumoniae M129-B7]ALA30271.1 2-oxoisovalerate dehydrogenase [Mycoplasmoides 